MLVLTRKVGEKILLQDLGITFTVLAVKPGGAVRIGIDADPTIRIVREEVQAAIDASNAIENAKDLGHDKGK